VVVIVLLVVHLTKTGSNGSASGTTTPSTGSTVAAAPSRYVLTQAAKAGQFPLNSTATKTAEQSLKSSAATVASQIKTAKAGTPGKEVVAIYDLTSVTDPSANDFKAAQVVGFNGTFNPAAVIKHEQTELISTRLVPAGPHGGEMICGYNRSTGSDASECVWATTSTFGEVTFTEGGTPVKYLGASDIALIIRDAVEQPAS
jgi:hypothetical protein